MAAVSVSQLLRRSLGKHFVRRKTKLRLFQPSGVRPELFCPCNFYCTQKLFRNDVTVQYRDGLPVISVPLPSRRESCQFTLKPITNNVGDFLEYIQKEDGGIDRASIYAEECTAMLESSRRNTLKEKRQRRKNREDVMLDSGRIFPCGRCGRACRSRIGLYSHQRVCGGCEQQHRLIFVREATP